MELKNSRDYFSKLGKLITAPGDFLSAAMEQKQWVLPFMVNSLLIFAGTYRRTPMIIREAADFSLIDGLRSGPLISISMGLMAVISFFLMACVVALLLYVFFGVGGSPGQYVHFFSVTMNGAIIGTGIPVVLSDLLGIFRYGEMGQLDLSLVFPGIATDSLTGAFLVQIEPFVIWFLVVAALGISRYAGMNRVKTFSIMTGYFFFRLIILGFATYFLSSLLQNSSGF